MKPQNASSSKAPCLQLFRIVRLADKLDSQIFTFTIPSQLTRGFIQSAQTREFDYGGQKWIVKLEYYSDPLQPQARRGSFVVHYQKQPLGVHLYPCNLTSGITAQLDFVRFTVLHQAHYSRNIVREETNISFTTINPSLKVPRWIESGYLNNEGYLFDDWSCLLEVELRGPVTIYEEQLRVPRDSKEALRCRSLESASFPFAGADWSVLIDWNSGNERGTNVHSPNPSDRAMTPQFCVQRHTKSKHWTRVRYRLTVTWHEAGETGTGIVDQLINPDTGSTTPVYPVGDQKWLSCLNGPLLTSKHRIFITVEMLTAIQLSRVDLIPTAPQGGKNCCRVSDPEGFDWIVMSDILGSLVKIRFFPDPNSRPPIRRDDMDGGTCTRLTTFSVQLIPYQTDACIVRSMTPYYTVYTAQTGKSAEESKKESSETLQEVVLLLDVEKIINFLFSEQIGGYKPLASVIYQLNRHPPQRQEVCSSEFGYSRPSDNAITLRIEWLQLATLYRGEFHTYDDLIHVQRHQIMRDLQAKLSELQRLTAFKVDGPSGRRQSARVSRDSSPTFSDRCRFRPNEDSPNSAHSYSPGPLQNQYAGRQTRHESMHDQRPYPGPTRTSAQSIRSSKVQTPPVLINGSPEGSCSDVRGELAAAPSWRRHSSCLEEVGSSGQRVRRRLPTPPGTPANQGMDSHLSVDFYSGGDYSGNPRLNSRHTNYDR
ncbi:unnamed protein product [Calicophoron daubneyi]|uniref:MATH domain-containing protein n=1 Tax=Calicophoron daubneyi TaxID=300641 RepID=A0AAV2TUZ1_CALDB